MDFSKLISKVTGKTIVLDKRISVFYLFRRGTPYLFGLLRGYFTQFNSKGQKGKKLYIGKHVSLLNKRQILFGNNVRIDHHVTIDALSQKGVLLGDNVKIGEYSKILCTGSLSDIGEGLSIAKNSFFSDYTFFGAAGGIKIGEDVIAGQYVRFHSEDHVFNDLEMPIRYQGVTRKGITVGNNCWIGSGVTFLDGAKIGDGCVVAANAVVTKEFPDNSVIGGVPAKVLKVRGL